MTSGMRLAPSSLRHLVWADISSLKVMASPVLRLKLPPLTGAVSNRGEGAFDGIGSPDVLPMFGREVIECQEHVAVFGQFGDGLVVFHAICHDEVIECKRGIHPRFSLPDVVQIALCLGLNRLRHRVQHIARFMEPAALLFRRAKDVAQSTPEARGTIADS